MFKQIIALCLVASAVAFAPAGSRVRQTSMKMALFGAGKELVGSDIEFPEYDPYGFSKTASTEQMAWYRAAELKHGRVAMLAALGQLFSSIHHPLLPAAINGDKPITAADNLLKENPLAAAQIIFFIFVAEALGQKNQVKSGVPGDLLFDPLGLKPEDPETWEKVQLRELKNGRLAMLAIAGMLFTELTNGNGVIEAWRIGQVTPWGDGKEGVF